jgi:hypothetical protein
MHSGFANALLLLTFPAALACGKGVEAPTPRFAGEYRLVLIGSNGLPFTFPNTTTTVTSSTLTVRDVGSFTEARAIAIAGAAPDTTVTAGTWALHATNNQLIVLTAPARSDTATSTSDISLSVRIGNRDWLFQRP